MKGLAITLFQNWFALFHWYCYIQLPSNFWVWNLHKLTTLTCNGRELWWRQWYWHLFKLFYAGPKLEDFKNSVRNLLLNVIRKWRHWWSYAFTLQWTPPSDQSHTLVNTASKAQFFKERRGVDWRRYSISFRGTIINAEMKIYSFPSIQGFFFSSFIW